jgi:hypothetical protein
MAVAVAVADLDLVGTPELVAAGKAVPVLMRYHRPAQ